MITEDYISQAAPDAASLSNGRKLSSGGKFKNHMKNESSTVYWAECEGSGKNPYKVSVQMEEGSSNAVCRCSCPSRKFPCKHGIGLMFEIAAGKEFVTGEIPEDLSAKIEKKAAAEAKKEARKDAILSGSPSKKSSKVTAAQKKKIEKQLESLDVAERFLDDILTDGIASIKGKSSSDFSEVSDMLANYVPGLNRSFLKIADSVDRVKNENETEKADSLYKDALNEIVYVCSVIKKSREFLKSSLEQKKDDSAFDEDDYFLFEALGGTWTLEKLLENKLYEENASLIQLSIETYNDEIKREIVDRAFYLNLNTKEIFMTLNMCPYSRRDKMKKDSSNFAVMDVPLLYKYPSHGCRRIRFEKFSLSEPSESDYKKASSSCEEDIPSAVKKVKNIIKNSLAQKEYPVIIPVSKILCDGNEKAVIADGRGNSIVLSTEKGFQDALDRFADFPSKIKEGDSAFGMIFYDEVKESFLFNPLAYLDGKKIIRLI